MKEKHARALKPGAKVYKVSNYDYAKGQYLKAGGFIVVEWTYMGVRNGTLQTKIYIKRNPGDEFEKKYETNLSGFLSHYARTPREALMKAYRSQLADLDRSRRSIKEHEQKAKKLKAAIDGLKGFRKPRTRAPKEPTVGHGTYLARVPREKTKVKSNPPSTGIAESL